MNITIVSIWLIISSFIDWVEVDIGDRLTVKLPTKSKAEEIYGVTAYFSQSKNCDFSVYVESMPGFIYPKNDKEVFELFQREESQSMKAGLFISSKNFTVGLIKGREICQYFNPKSTIKMIEYSRFFYYKGKQYLLRCLFTGKEMKMSQDDCNKFFKSLSFR